MDNFAKFDAGKTYTCRSIGDHHCVITARIIKRTEKTVSAEVDGSIKTFRLGVWNDGTCEFFRPWGSYSMAPFMRAG